MVGAQYSLFEALDPLPAIWTEQDAADLAVQQYNNNTLPPRQVPNCKGKDAHGHTNTFRLQTWKVTVLVMYIGRKPHGLLEIFLMSPRTHAFAMRLARRPLHDACMEACVHPSCGPTISDIGGGWQEHNIWISN